MRLDWKWIIKIIIDNQEVACREGISVLQAALEGGWDVPHYCYHPALRVVASCRLCLMEMMVPDPKSGELNWMPKLVPSCQTPVRDGLIVRFDSDSVRQNVTACMEFFLLNHPLDCPVCDQAGECYLQDYSYRFGRASSRMFEEKLKNPKKAVGSKTLLYQDRCVLCTRCVRFCQEISGTGELAMVQRGSRAEIDVFPGVPLENPLQGNVVDICPVGALLDREFLFKKRVWHLQRSESICPGCSTGCAIHIDHDEGVIERLKPRFNPQVNGYWMCDEGRFGWRYALDSDRLIAPIVRRGSEPQSPSWDSAVEIVIHRLRQFVDRQGADKLAVVVSPMMSCEEAWLLLRFIREHAPQARAAVGFVPLVGADQHFPVGCDPGRAKFTIRAEKCPNRRGVELLVEKSGLACATFDQVMGMCTSGQVRGAWISGGYPDRGWVSKELAEGTGGLDLLVVQDLFPSALTATADIVLPLNSWAEREGTFMNHGGLLQRFERAVKVPTGARRENQYLFELAGFTGLFDADDVREMMASEMPEFREVVQVPEKPAHQH